MNDRQYNNMMDRKRELANLSKEELIEYVALQEYPELVTMTRKDYISMAKLLKDSREEMSPELFEKLVRRMADWFASDNPRFDRQRFEDACKS